MKSSDQTRQPLASLPGRLERIFQTLAWARLCALTSAPMLDVSQNSVRLMPATSGRRRLAQNRPQPGGAGDAGLFAHAHRGNARDDHDREAGIRQARYPLR
jgi:hypothetical protein